LRDMLVSERIPVFNAEIPRLAAFEKAARRAPFRSRPGIPLIDDCRTRLSAAIRCINTAKQIDPDLNVIVITGYPDYEILDRILQVVSPVTVLKKPLKIEQLNQTVMILGRKRPSWTAEQQSSKAPVGYNVECKMI
jgi:DNA-binding LytR/AlgR family response regulator